MFENNKIASIAKNTASVSPIERSLKIFVYFYVKENTATGTRENPNKLLGPGFKATISLPVIYITVLVIYITVLVIS